MSEHVFDQSTYELLEKQILTALNRHDCGSQAYQDLLKVAETVGLEVVKTEKVETTLEEYFLAHQGKSIDFNLRVNYPAEGSGNCLSFYIHPANVDGETLDYKVEGNAVKCITRKFIN